jgi:hypothetical protein
VLGRLAERFHVLPSELVGLRFSGEDCDLGVSYDFDQAIRLRLQFKDTEEYEELERKAKESRDDLASEKRRARRRS